MSDHAFSIGTAKRFLEIVSPLPARQTQDAMLEALHGEGFTIAPGEYTSGPWSVRYGEIGDDSSSNWSGLLIELVPIVSLFGARRAFARCAVPVAVSAHPGGSRLLASTVWGFRGEGGTVGLVAKRVTAAAQVAAARVGGLLETSMSPIDRSAPFTLKQFDELTGWKKRRA